MKANFTELFIAVNDIDREDLQSWVFCENMTFNAQGKWWGDYGQRDFPHEGIDICLYEGRGGKISQLDAQSRIPVMYDGVVKALFDDYLGQAVIIEHESIEGDGGKYLSAYAHTTPRPGIQPGTMVQRGDVIANIADTRDAKAKILPHLHYSLGRPSQRLVYQPFVWNMMRDPDLVTLLDPLAMIEGPSHILTSQDRYCRKE